MIRNILFDMGGVLISFDRERFIARFDVDQEDLVNADPQVRIKCSDCYNVFSKEELLKENVEIIDIAVEEVRQASAMEFEKDLKKALKKLKL